MRFIAVIEGARVSPREPTPSLEIQYLRQLVRPLSETAATRSFPAFLGARAGELMARQGVTDQQLWCVLQARVHAKSMQEFSHELRKALGPAWEARDCEELWDTIVLPCL